MSSTKTSSLFTSEVADLFRQASAQQEAINNEAAALMYAAIHRGERDIRMLEHIADPLSDAEYAGEEHYRNLILDYDTPNEKIYHCGASSKDGGNKVMTISLQEDAQVYHALIDNALTNPPLTLV